MSTNPYRKEKEVDVLIRGWENTDLTQKLLASIHEDTDIGRLNIIYVDNGSNYDNVEELFNHWEEHVTFVRLPFNHGSVRAINIGIALAAMSTAEWILLLDNDTEIPDGDTTWLDRWIAAFDDGGEKPIGAVGATSNYVSGLQHIEYLPDTYQREWQHEGESGIKTIENVPMLVSFALMLRKEAVLKCGMFDEQFEPGNMEDYDYSFRLHEAGYRCTIAPSVWIHHKGSQTFKDMGFDTLLDRNMKKLLSKWSSDRLAAMGIQVQA